MQKGNVIRVCFLTQLCMSPDLNTDLTKITIKLCWEMTAGCTGVLVKQFGGAGSRCPNSRGSQATGVMSAHMSLETDAPKRFLLAAAGQLQCLRAWVGVRGTGISSPPRMGIRYILLKLKHQEGAITVC